MDHATIRQLTKADFRPDMLKDFDRYQEVKRCWRNVDGEWVLRDNPFIDQWSEAEKQDAITRYLPDCMASGGAVWGAFLPDGRLIGFASLSGRPMGSRGQYRKLVQLHVSNGHRGGGFGKKLFLACAEKAKEMGAEKLYISTHSSEESQAFYRRMGCVDALEIDAKTVALGPYDRQMERPV